MTEIIVTGYPKSGNTWLTRLLSDALDYPVTGIDNAIPLAADQQERNGDGLIRQLHLVPRRNNEARFVASRYYLNPNNHNGERVIHIIRDPRDMAVAIKEYWELADIYTTITNVMATGAWPLWGMGWPEWMQDWRSTDLPYIETRYEWLHADTEKEIRRLCDDMGLTIVKPLAEVIERQSIDVKRKALRDTDDQAFYLPHGKGAQLQNLRGGRVGDWRERFGPDDKQAALEVFSDWLIRLGYESDANWLN